MRWIALLALLAGCDDTSSVAADVGRFDTAMDARLPTDGAGRDAVVPADVAADARRRADAAADAASDGAPDESPDTAPDGSPDAASDAGLDAAPDGAADAVMDARLGPTDVDVDARPDTDPIDPDMAPIPDLGPDAALLGPCGEVPEGFACIPPGVFVMGSAFEEAGRVPELEAPHRVRVTRPFLAGVTEVTRAQWSVTMLADPSFNDFDPELPVEGVTWFDAVAYCNVRSAAEGLPRCYGTPGDDRDYDDLDGRLEVEPVWRGGLDCRGYRLPTEAEWAYAARAGHAGATHNDLPWVLREACADALDPVAWYTCSSDDALHHVGTLIPNAWGLHDVQGNLIEWVWDAFDSGYGGFGMAEVAVVDPVVDVGDGRGRVQRSCSAFDPADECRLAFRLDDRPSRVAETVGFRVVRAAP